MTGVIIDLFSVVPGCIELEAITFVLARRCQLMDVFGEFFLCSVRPGLALGRFKLSFASELLHLQDSRKDEER